MRVASENIRYTQVLHDDHGSEINERNIRLVQEFLPHFPGAAKFWSCPITFAGFTRDIYHPLIA
jgi:hypothetical protein